MIKRVFASVPVVAVTAIIVFALLRLTPGDPAAVLAGENATAQQVDQLRQTLGLDQPLPLQFWVWAQALLHGDLGLSLISGQPVTALIAGRMGPTLAVSVTSVLFTLIVAIPLGVAAAHKPGGAVDRLVSCIAAIGVSVPAFVIGYILIYLVALRMGWLPVQGYRPLSDGLWPHLQRLILPTLALSGAYIALVARMTRSSLIAILHADYIRTARAKGAPEHTVLLRHGLRNAAVPIVTVVGAGVASLITGVVVTESVFNLPGLGRLMVEALLARDYPVIQGLILLFALIYIAINLIVDLLYVALTPRLRTRQTL
ncbi:ABC transporter permease [Ketogulonicigenium robustum]|uniref:ABC transporter permease n=1 Tax=Ketogulonicigenium robustum TaxID=92947 RepID=UPI00300129EF